ncbi:sigma-70 family RNA polymerase sigma factor [Cohnella sp. AR92]|uniref:sigma-70 family RNA polymerase sigma factor n=1 Tax=Cohnella sp. AR92 TaxID=648716 RepID=UPI000F8D37DF|nr:sigma-70 family RNA polymerase sigma factor [Cohnella sp. AR92]RUS48312.1 sigma-70 family RNA polymerase sigma factor [Cohnella sp. AR92]
MERLEASMADEGREARIVRWYGTLRAYLFSIAYRMLGSATDAEDAIQDVFVKLQRMEDVELGQIRQERAYLAKLLVNRCLNFLKSAGRRKEDYVGEWLPLPIVDRTAPSPEDAAERKEDISYALLVLLEKLNPVERAAFVLRETMDCDYAEIAALLDKSEANCRQLVSRSKRKLEAERRLEAERCGARGNGNQELPAPIRANRPQELELVRRFLDAFSRGQPEELASLLMEDTVLLMDGGGRVHAAINPIYGRKRALALLKAMYSVSLAGARFEFVETREAGPAIAAWQGDRFAAILMFEWAQEAPKTGEEPQLRHLYTIYNPDKLKLLRPDVAPKASEAPDSSDTSGVQS